MIQSLDLMIFTSQLVYYPGRYPPIISGQTVIRNDDKHSEERRDFPKFRYLIVVLFVSVLDIKKGGRLHESYNLLS